MNKTSTGDLQERVRSSCQRVEPGGDQDCVTNFILRCLAGKQGIWVSCTKYFVPKVLVLLMGNRRSSARKGPGVLCVVGSEDTPGNLAVWESQAAPKERSSYDWNLGATIGNLS